VSANTVSTGAGDLTDDDLDFGVMKIVAGKAFLLGTNSPSVAVNKQWLVSAGRQLLVEEVPMASIANELESLPMPAIQTSARTTTPTVSRHLILPPQRLAKTPTKSMRLAKGPVM
jgi:hypothetical protein